MIGMGGVGLADNNQRVHITIHDTVTQAPNCPTNYQWSSTGEACIRVVLRINAASGRDEEFLPLQPSEILYAASVNLKLEHAFYALGKRFRTLSADQKLSCSDIRALGNTDKPDTSLQAQYLTFARGEMLYSLKCKRRKVYVAADWDPCSCFRKLPVWIYLSNHEKKLRFLTPGLRLLLKSSRPENCMQGKTIPRGY